MLGGIDAPHLIVSTKYTLGDFYSHLPLNDDPDRRATSGGSSSSRRRREFEGFGALPNDLGADAPAGAAAVPRRQPAHRGRLDLDPGRRPAARRADDALPADRVLAAVRPQHVRHRRGWRGTRTPTPAQLTADWARADVLRRPGDRRPRSAQAMALSREAVTKGLYIGPFADQTVKALGLEPPPMMWIFEWDIVTGDSAALDSIYAVSRRPARRRRSPRATGRSAVAERHARPGRRHRPGHLARPGAARALPRHARLRGRPVRHARRVPRRMVLRHAQWLDTGIARRLRAVARGRARATATARDAHVAALRRRRRPARLQLHRRRPRRGARRPRPGDGVARPGAAGVLLGCCCAVAAAASGGRRSRARPALRALLLGATRPWRLAALRGAADAARTGSWSGRAGGGAGREPAGSTPGSPRRRTCSSTLGGWLLFAARAGR